MAISKNQIKYVKSLQQKKFRQMYGNFVAEGDKLAKEILTHSKIKIEGVFASSTWLGNNSILFSNLATDVFEVSEKELGRISGLKTPNQVLIIAKQLEHSIDWEIVNNGLSIYLDRIQNPGNIGTIIRIADWFGIPYIFCSENAGELYNPKVIQSSMGAFLRVNYVSHEFEDLQNRLDNIPFYGAVMNGEDVFKMKLSENGLIVIGNEGQGISSKILEKINNQVSIYPHSLNGSESLNASVATGIICAAFRNQ
jgi:TrmH family RNA methyltransferase